LAMALSGGSHRVGALILRPPVSRSGCWASPRTSPSANAPRKRFALARLAWRPGQNWPASAITKWTTVNAPASWTTGSGRSAVFPGTGRRASSPWRSGGVEDHR
jgi:hypothetical protein